MFLVSEVSETRTDGHRSVTGSAKLELTASDKVAIYLELIHCYQILNRTVRIQFQLLFNWVSHTLVLNLKVER